MPKQESPLIGLKKYLPENTFEEVEKYLVTFKVHLTITKERKSILGNYINSYANNNHRISVNGNLNKYAFLITLLHELAHLFTFEKYGHKVSAHGMEWKREFSNILALFLQKNVFPADIHQALLKSIKNPAASSCADISLTRVLHQYDNKQGKILVESLPVGSLFIIEGGRVFKKEHLIRKRIKCIEVATNKAYLFSPVFEVIAIENV
jgi:SprT protein